MHASVIRRTAIILCVACWVWLCGGCTVVASNRVFPKLSWYWSAEAQEQRRAGRNTKVSDGSGL